MTAQVSVFHISDLHYSKKYIDQNILLIDPLLRDIESFIEQFRRPDLIIFSGDLVNNPDEPDIYFHLIDFIDSLTSKSGVSPERLIFCPGNHDVHRSELTASALEYDALQANKGDLSYINELYRKGRLTEYTKRINRGFFSFCDAIGRPWKNPFYHMHTYPDIGAQVLTFNSTLACSLDGSEADRGKIAIPTLALLDGIAQKDSTCWLSLSTCHHPITDLAEATHRVLEPILLNYSAAHFFGHVHEPAPSLRVLPQSSTVFCQAGALYSEGTDFQGYAAASFSSSLHVEVLLRGYQARRNQFDIFNGLSADGAFYPTAEDRSFWSEFQPRLDRAGLTQWLRAQADPIQQDAKTFGGQSLKQVYVSPPLGNRSSTTSEDSEVQYDMWTDERIINSNDNLLVTVPAEFGATSLLTHIAASICEKIEPEKARIPLLIDIRNVKSYDAHVKKALRAAHPESSHDRFGWSVTQSAQPYAVMIDNCDPSSEEHGAVLKAIHTVLPKARYIVSIRTSLGEGARIALAPSMPFGYTSLTIIPFNRSRVRSLVRKWELPNHFSESAVVEELLVRFRTLNIPLTGPHISMFLLVLSSQRKFAP